MSNPTQSYPFSFLVDIQTILMNKPRLAGSFRTDEGEEIAYGDAVQIKLQAIRTRFDKDLEQEVEYEDDVSVEIPCESSLVLKQVLKVVNDLKSDGTPFQLPVTINSRDKVSYLYGGAEFLNYIKAQLKAQKATPAT